MMYPADSCRQRKMASAYRPGDCGFASPHIASDSFKDNLLAEIEVGYSEDYRPAAGEGAGQEGEVVAGGVVVIIEGIHDALLTGQGADIFLKALDDLRSGEQGLPGKAHDLLLVFRAPVFPEELSGSGERSMMEQGEFQESGGPLQQGAFRREDIQGGKQVIEGTIVRFPGAADQQAAHQEAMDAGLQWPLCVKSGFGDGLFIQVGDFFLAGDAPAQACPECHFLQVEDVFVPAQQDDGTGLSMAVGPAFKASDGSVQ